MIPPSPKRADVIHVGSGWLDRSEDSDISENLGRVVHVHGLSKSRSHARGKPPFSGFSRGKRPPSFFFGRLIIQTVLWKQVGDTVLIQGKRNSMIPFIYFFSFPLVVDRSIGSNYDASRSYRQELESQTECDNPSKHCIVHCTVRGAAAGAHHLNTP